MQALQLALPALATAALGAALLAPSRAGRDGRRPDARRQRAPLRPDFTAVAPCAPSDAGPGVEAASVRVVRVVRVPLFRRVRTALESRLYRVRLWTADLEPAAEAAESPAKDEIEAHADAAAHDEAPQVIERSFAGELAALLPHASAASSGTARPEEAPGFESPPLVVTGTSTRSERVVPLTRLPLRTYSSSVSWPASAGNASGVGMTRVERHAYLAAAGRAGADPSEETLVCAYREEDDDGRILAMRALVENGCAAARGVCIDALRSGRDDERALAIDALAELGDREALAPALTDRLDAVAARAALAFVGNGSRAEYRRVLEPHLNAARVDAILELLAGIVE